MTDPSEAARYTPPREMFKQQASIQDAEDISLPTSSETNTGIANHSNNDGILTTNATTPSTNPHQPSPEAAAATTTTGVPSAEVVLSNGSPAETDLDNLGEQLSLHSPSKSTIQADHELASLNSHIDSTEATSDLMSFEYPPVVLASSFDRDQDDDVPELTHAVTSAPPLDEQMATIMDFKHRRLELGDVYCLISSTWFSQFRKYCIRMARGVDEDYPGELDNSDLLEDGTLKLGIADRVQPLPEAAWPLLVSWYGSRSAPIYRKVVNTGTDEHPNLSIDYYPPVYTIYKVGDADLVALLAHNEPETIEVPRSTKFGDLKAALVSRLGISQNRQVRLWAVPSYRHLNAQGNGVDAETLLGSGAICLDTVENDYTISEVNDLRGAKEVIIEVAVDGEFPVQRASSQTSRFFGSTGLSSTFTRGYGSPRSPASPGKPAEGLCGLSNLGNTCFMNSALQCLSNTPDLTHYILAGAWRDELNLDNPLGMGGEVARAYANVIDKIWNGTSKVFSPREFKQTIGRFAPSFTGYHQHASQELLAFLLDGLHEDLNRIIKKPYTEVPDSNGRPDEEVASDCWNIHKARNDSIIVDLFQGQYKSTLVCPECEKVSVTFDPFMYLSLPLPITKKWAGSVIYVPYDPTQPLIEVKLQLPKGSTIKQLREKVADLVGTQAGQLFVAEVFNARFYKTFEASDAVEEIGDNDKIYVYELPIQDFLNSPDHVVFPVHNLMEPASHYATNSRVSAFGHPMMVCVAKEDTKDLDKVYEAIVEQANRYTTADLYAPADNEILDEAENPSSEVEDEDEIMDTGVSPMVATGVERGPQRDLFKMSVFTPPPIVTKGYMLRGGSRSTLFAPAIMPTPKEMTPMHERTTPHLPKKEQEMDFYPSYGRQRLFPGRFSEDRYSPFYRPPASPSGVSESSTSSSKPQGPLAGEDEVLDEDEPEAGSSTADTAESPSQVAPEPVLVTEPAVEPKEMVYIFWTKSLESSICPVVKVVTYRTRLDEDEKAVSAKALWEQRGIPIVDPVLQEEQAGSKRGKKDITLEDCLAEYTKEEQLGEEDLWYCPNCKKHQQATKKLDIWRLPDILVVHLKRFSHTRTWRDKIDALVDFPIHGLDLSGKILKEEDRDENVYDLFGVSNHMGGLGGGHYTAYAKNERSGQWYNFDDSHVSAVGNVESIKSSSAYLLFYRRRNATVREYEQRPPVADPEPEPQPSSSSSAIHYGGYLGATSVRNFKIQERDDDDDGEYGPWGRPPIGPFQDDNMMSGLNDSDDELPSYSSAIGPSGLASPRGSYSGQPAFMIGARHGKGRRSSMHDDDDDDDEATLMSGHISEYPNMSGGRGDRSPGMSTCASDGSNPGTASGSRAHSPVTLDTFSGSGLESYGTRGLSGISRAGGRIDGSDYENDGYEEYAQLGSGAGIPTPGSMTATTDVGDDADGEGEQDGVNMIPYDDVPLRD
ncbi:CSN-associated deubiquitinating enzyme Ubp12 [Linnemannia schmuckeri]|uniref:ubiquitinyl hydrolase 1 n=1 Tax=Linnemannia schmuckeri TaxID=64567 RepID=A0A9P5RX16_9FUNG|nr:CSN-associated deubiquitinating enzyme Ubp12 [Linnemannia schmuckeri]